MSEYNKFTNQFANIETFLEQKGITHLPSGTNWVRIICPFCGNPKQKCGVNKLTGGFHCFHCQANGNFKTLADKLGNPDAKLPEVTQEQLSEQSDPPPIDLEIIEEHHQRLFSDIGKPILEHLHIKRLYTDETIKKRKIGIDTRSNIVFPLFNKNGECVNLKFRSDPTSPSSKTKFFGVAGYNRNRLFNESVLLQDLEYVVINEGEQDTILLSQLGINAVSPTAGAGKFEDDWVQYFEHIPKIILVPDYDAVSGTGQKGARKIAELFYKHGITVYIANLHDKKEKKFIEKEDVTSYFVKYGDEALDKFSKLLITARQFNAPKEIKNKWTETPHLIPKQPLLTSQVAYQQMEEKVLSLLPSTQDALKVVLATAASSFFQFPAMVWLLLVDVPSSGKTDFARFIKDAPCTFYLDNLTQNAFISGERPTETQEVYDLLPLLDKKCFIVKDWTSIFSLDEKMTKKILGDLVGIYDREFSKFSSRRGNIAYESYFSHIGCVTPATLNRHSTYMNMVGARFLCYNLPPTSTEDEVVSRTSIFNAQDRTVLEKETRQYVSSYLQQLSQQQLNIKSISQPAQEYLWIAASLVASCRGIIMLQMNSFKNEEGEEVKYYDILDSQIEKPWRALHQLIALAKCLAFVVGKDEVGVEELRIIKDVVLSSMPADRSRALRAIKERSGHITAKELTDVSDVSQRTSKRLLEELYGLKVLDKIKGSGSMAADYMLVNKFHDFVCLDTTDFLSSYSGKSETPQGIQQEEQVNLNQEEQPSSTDTEEIIQAVLLPKVEPDNSLKQCYCGSKKFWLTRFNNVVCAVCHPPASEIDVVEWREAL